MGTLRAARNYLYLRTHYNYVKIEKPAETIVEHVEYVSVETQPMEFAVTAYCSCRICCGIWADNRPNGIVYTASGAEAIEGVTVGVDTKIIPYGTMIYIDGIGMRIAQDVGSAIKGNRLDLYFNNHAAALEFGRQTLKVWILGE